jgi:hypothetical protein
MNHVNYVYRTSDEVDWSLAPDWANFYTIDSDSERWWFENKPTSNISPFGVLYWDAKTGNSEQAPGFRLDDHWYYVYTREPMIRLTRIFDNGKYILINDSAPDQPWFTLFEEIEDREYVDVASFYYANDAIEYIWNKISN